MSTKKYNGVKVILDPDIHDPDDFEARRPYYRIRGPKVTEQQAFEIIRKTDRVFRISLEGSKYEKLGYIDTMNFGQLWFNKNYCDSPQGWSHPNGIIGENGITGKYPDLDEFLWEFTEYSKAFPFLDMIVAVADWDEIPPYAWDLEYDDPIRKNEDYKDFVDNIEIGFWLHNGSLEVLSKERAQQVYAEYVHKYEEADTSIYVAGYYNDRNIMPANFEYLKRLIAAYGLNPDHELANYPWKNWLEGKPDESTNTSPGGFLTVIG